MSGHRTENCPYASLSMANLSASLQATPDRCKSLLNVFLHVIQGLSSFLLPFDTIQKNTAW